MISQRTERRTRGREFRHWYSSEHLFITLACYLGLQEAWSLEILVGRCYLGSWGWAHLGPCDCSRSTVWLRKSSAFSIFLKVRFLLLFEVGFHKISEFYSLTQLTETLGEDNDDEIIKHVLNTLLCKVLNTGLSALRSILASHWLCSYLRGTCCRYPYFTNMDAKASNILNYPGSH